MDKHVVMSLPHSGTRTLQTYLAETRPETIPADRDQPKHMHFTLHAGQCLPFLEDPAARAYVPIRNLYGVCDSWNRRYHNAEKRGEEDLVAGLDLMHDVIANYPDQVEVFKMERLPVLRGVGPNPEGHDYERGAIGTDRLQAVKNWIRINPAVESFYRGLYTRKELWWL